LDSLDSSQKLLDSSQGVSKKTNREFVARDSFGEIKLLFISIFF